MTNNAMIKSNATVAMNLSHHFQATSMGDTSTVLMMQSPHMA